MTYREHYERGVRLLTDAGVPEAKLDARLLLEHVCETDINALLLHGEEPVKEDAAARYTELLSARAGRIPLQQLTGIQTFCGLDFKINEHVLIPRQDTEILVETALLHLKPGMEVLDMCTGSGCILISLLILCNGLLGTGADISEDALLVAAENAERLLPRDKRPRLLKSDLFAQFEPYEYDMIVSNPPYIPDKELAELMPEVKDHEPRLALYGGEDGLLYYRRIVKEGGPYLKEGGLLILEIGHDQGEDVSGLLGAAGYREVEIKKDYAGLDRVVIGRKKQR